MIADANSLSGLTYHHTGLLVENIETSKVHYTELFGKENVSETIRVSSQKVNVCFVKVSDESYIELVQPVGEDSVVYKLLKKGATYYHMAYKVKDLRAVVERLEQLNYKSLDYFHSEAFAGKLCIFLFSPEAHLIELIEE